MDPAPQNKNIKPLVVTKGKWTSKGDEERRRLGLLVRWAWAHTWLGERAPCRLGLHSSAPVHTTRSRGRARQDGTVVPECPWGTETEGNQSFAPQKLPFGILMFKLLVKKRETQKERLTLPDFLGEETQTENPAPVGKQGVPLGASE